MIFSILVCVAAFFILVWLLRRDGVSLGLPVAYLRALPAVPGRVPAPRPPRADDPVADTFGFGDHAIR